MEETENVSGGFDFGLDYRIRKREANIKGPVCGAEGMFTQSFAEATTCSASAQRKIFCRLPFEGM